MLILRRCNPDGSSSHGFIWPKSGFVEAKDFDSTSKCGGGLHGWAWGMAMGEGAEYNIIDDLWIVFAAKPSDVVGNLDGGQKCKARCAEVVFAGSFSAAWAMVNSGRHRLIEAMANRGAANIASGNYSTAASSGDYCFTAVAGAGGKIKTGTNSAFAIGYMDGHQPRFLTGVSGENGVKSDTWYRVENGGLVED